MEWQNIVALVVPLPFILIPVLYVWYITVGGAYQSIFGRRTTQLSCSVDSDCPPGYICADGACVPSPES